MYLPRVLREREQMDREANIVKVTNAINTLSFQVEDVTSRSKRQSILFKFTKEEQLRELKPDDVLIAGVSSASPVL